MEAEVKLAGSARRRIFAPLAYLPDGWTRNVAITIDARGFFSEVVANSADNAGEKIAGVMLPGMVNAHSHAFQRAMVGLTQFAGPGADNFWSWRALMYELALRVSPAQIESIATWVYIEMLRGGYTHVCEFHYLHNDSQGRHYADPAELSRAVLRAARRTGIGITLLPVLYMTSGFGGQPALGEQRRFLSTPERLLDVVRTLRTEHLDDTMVAFGLAPHSLRAVPAAALRDAAAGLRAIDAGAPLHIHVAEQTGEIDACVAWSGLRPVQWLLDHEAVDQGWNLVHATHMSADESLRVATAGATVVLCPTTEADLGDGVFDYPEYARAHGDYAIGSDSQVCRDWQSELRMLEYSQRLALRQRNVAALPGSSTGDALFCAALNGGAKASGLPLGRIAAGARADWIVVREDKLAFAGRSPARYLDSLIFDHHTPDFSDIVVGGRSRRAALEGENYRAARVAFARTLREMNDS